MESSPPRAPAFSPLSRCRPDLRLCDRDAAAFDTHTCPIANWSCWAGRCLSSRAAGVVGNTVRARRVAVCRAPPCNEVRSRESERDRCGSIGNSHDVHLGSSNVASSADGVLTGWADAHAASPERSRHGHAYSLGTSDTTVTRFGNAGSEWFTCRLVRSEKHLQLK